jgi:phosphoglycerate dehydrogenase-like enzyme
MAIDGMLDIPDTLVTEANWREHKDLLKEAEVLVSTWGGPALDEEKLAAMPNLKAYFYGAGEMSHLMTEEAWIRGIRITTAAKANAIPVAEFTLAQILFSLKRGWEYMARAKQGETHLWGKNKQLPGTYGSTVGIVSIGLISRKLLSLLKSFELRVVACCPQTSPEEARELDVEFLDMESLFSVSDVVSIHLRGTERNRGCINRSLLNCMKPHATLINTSRGSVINKAHLTEFLKDRPDIYACLDVMEPEPPEPECALFTLPNVVLTPHLAGSMDRESLRMGDFIVQELRNYLSGLPLEGEVTNEIMQVLV